MTMDTFARLSQRIQRMQHELGPAYARRVLKNTLRNLYAASKRETIDAPAIELFISRALEWEGY